MRFIHFITNRQTVQTFALAKYDEAGNSPTGITRAYTDIQGFDEEQYNIHQTLRGGKDNWNATKFLNI